MPILLGTVRHVDLVQGGVISLDRGDDLRISAADLAILQAPPLEVGTRVHLRVTGDKVTRLQVVALSAPVSSHEIRLSARIEAIDHLSRILHLSTADGPRSFQPRGLSEVQWSELVPGRAVTLVREPNGAERLEWVQDRTAQPRALVAPEVQTTVSGTGIVVGLSDYYGEVQGDDGGVYSFIRTRFPGLSVRQGDRVTFRALPATGQIIDLSVVERVAPGVGGWDPCNSGAMKEVRQRAKRRALLELVDHLCSEQRLEWHWLTPGEPPTLEPVDGLLTPEVVGAIAEMVQPQPFTGLYRHQVQALHALRSGKHVLVLTPTASGKTLCYNPAIFQTLQGDPAARALYVFPLNALLQDQVEKLQAMAGAMRAQGIPVTIDLLIGGLAPEERSRIRNHPPQLLATNPEMLSWVLDGNSFGGWSNYFRSLRYVVLDEAHSYRSLLGLHMAGLVRRLLTVCQRYGNPGPQFVLSSATVGAPEELATRLTPFNIEDYVVIREEEDGSGRPQRHWMLLPATADVETNAHDQHLHQAAQALVDVLTVPRNEALSAILFAKSIRDVRILSNLVKRALVERGRPELCDQVDLYASALLSHEEKRRIYGALSAGNLRAVISTNALEAGVDIGHLDVCILAGFPFHVMRMRQMAGRAGRRSEGAVMYIPHPLLTVDRYYADRPERLLTQPPEAFVIDHTNPYIGRKHILASAASLAGGVSRQELESFGSGVDQILEDGVNAGLLEALPVAAYAARWPGLSSPEEWRIGNMRAAEQDPFIVCNAAPTDQPRCLAEGGFEVCAASAERDAGAGDRCPHLVQLLDRQYVYREAHPGAVFEDLNGDFREAVNLDEVRKVVSVRSMEATTSRRTFGAEYAQVHVLKERGRRQLVPGVEIVWGDVRVTREYAGYFEYFLVPKRRCRTCKRSYDESVTRCTQCGGPTRYYLASTRPKFRDFPGLYAERIYSLELVTTACWLSLPASLERQLEPTSRCRIPGPSNQVNLFLHDGQNEDGPEALAARYSLPPAAAQAVHDYSEQHRPIVATARPDWDNVLVYPAYYGQCLRYSLRQALPETEALDAYGKVTKYPVTTDTRHVCRNCVGSTLLLAAHTVEHLIAMRYPTVALGDSQDLGTTTFAIHPTTRMTTVFWYDNYKGGIGAAEKIFKQFEQLLHKALEGLACDCGRDEGCPICTQTLRCDRRNEVLSKVSARGLLHYLLGMAAYIPEEVLYWSKNEAGEREKESMSQERAAGPVPAPGEASEQRRAHDILHVQPYVHDQVLDKVVSLRAEELQAEVPPISMQAFQIACDEIRGTQRPQDWQFLTNWTPHQVLHVQREASKRLTQTAYKTIIRNVHPDLNPARVEWATEAAKQVNAAWEKVKTSWAAQGQNAEEDK